MYVYTSIQMLFCVHRLDKVSLFYLESPQPMATILRTYVGAQDKYIHST